MDNDSFTILWRQLPDYFKPVLEFMYILQAHGYALDSLDSMIYQVGANTHIATCDEQTIAYWESLLGLTYSFGETLDYRRSRVLQKFNTIVPFSIGFLNDKLTELYGTNGYTLSVDPVACTLTVKVTSGRHGAIDLLYDLLWDVVPAHIKIIANQQVTNNITGGRIYVAGAVSSTVVQTI